MSSKWIKKKQRSDEAVRMAREIGNLSTYELFSAAGLVYDDNDDEQKIVGGLLREVLLSSGKPPSMLSREQTWMCALCNRAIVDYGTTCINCRNKRHNDESSESPSIGIAAISNEE
jgi:hypothetical protein